MFGYVSKFLMLFCGTKQSLVVEIKKNILSYRHWISLLLSVFVTLKKSDDGRIYGDGR